MCDLLVAQEATLLMRTSSGLHSHSLHLAKQDSINSLQTTLRQQYRQRKPSALLSQTEPLYPFDKLLCPSMLGI